MPNKRLRCFVAMAFGREDNDEIYDRVIEKVLVEDFDVVRVDRKEHNRNIDQVIMEELATCDFALADLTYARPSVYYEAGYAERRVPVIYTARKDHLKPGGEDEHLRIHFDLQMKNIVDWSSVEDTKFPIRLRKRLAHVTKPLIRDLDAEARVLAERRQFSSLSRVQQNEALSKAAQETLIRRGYQALDLVGDVTDTYGKRIGTTLALVTVLVPDRAAAPKAVREYMEPLHFLALHKLLPQSRFSRFRNLIETIDDRVILATPERINLAAMRRTFPHATVSEDGLVLSWRRQSSRKAFLRAGMKDAGSDTRIVGCDRLHFIPAIRSVEDFLVPFDGAIVSEPRA